MPRIDFTSTRLFVDAPFGAGWNLHLRRDQSHYLANVLRLAPGHEILVFNGRDGEWRARLCGSKVAVALDLVEEVWPQPPPGRLHYCFAPLKHARLDYLVQKAVEMGASVLRPILTSRTQAARVNLERMRSNVIEAAEQCGVLAVPEVREPSRFADFLAGWANDNLIVFCDEDAPIADPLEALKGADPAGAGDIAVVVGPEGGFDEAERRALLATTRHVRLSLGPRILRADTAAVAAMALVQAVLGDGSAGRAAADQKIGMPPATTTMAPDV